jgi:hypothetical protein
MTYSTNGAAAVLALEINRNGEVTKKLNPLDREHELTNTLLEALYPGIAVATVDVPQEELSPFERATVEQSLARLDWEGQKFALIGASGSAKNGKFYAVDPKREREIALRFGNWPEAAMTYFGILVSDCMVRIQKPECRVLVVMDHELGTNDCRGWISQALFRDLQATHKSDLLKREIERLTKIHPNLATAEIHLTAERNVRHSVIPHGAFYQFRLAFERTQAKGSFKVMSDLVAATLDADIILPASAVKPEYKGKPTLLKWLTGSARTFRGPVVLGIRDVSRTLEFRASYTLVEHAPADSMELEIKPYALAEIEKVRAAFEGRQFESLLELLGTSEAQAVIGVDDDQSYDPEYTGIEHTIVEAVLKADPTGYMLKHPWINAQVDRLLAKWAYKVSTAGGVRLPAFALADDGYLVQRDGEVFSGSDWIPLDSASVNLASDRLLSVRYPIRTKEDLLPVTRLTTSEMLPLLMEHLAKAGCTMTATEALDKIIEPQLRLRGTLTMHSETARRNGGDYDFDYICLVESEKFPRWVEDRFNYQERLSNHKQKLTKKHSPWWNLPQVAMAAKGNSIGAITDLKTSALAAGRTDLAEQLAVELQAALDQLKHGTEPDRERITQIRKEVGSAAPWLKCKTAKRTEDLPLHFDGIVSSDVVGELYNSVRKRIHSFLSKDETLPISSFGGLIVGARFEEKMFREATKINRIYARMLGRMRKKQAACEQAAKEAEAEFERVKDNARARKEALFRLKQARGASRFYEREKSRQEMKTAICLVRKWAERKTENRQGWLQALHSKVCQGQGVGSIVFYAFPQELVNGIVERTGGRPILVRVPDLAEGEVEIGQDGEVFLVSRFAGPNGEVQERRILYCHITEDGDLYMDSKHGRPVLIEKIRPFKVSPGRSEVRAGMLVMPETAQRPAVPVRRVN